MSNIDLRLGDCLEVLPTIPSGSVDAVITDPPYPEIDREYGRWTEAEWHELMRGVVAECRRILKPSGSAVFVLQPNSERVGRMRAWLWDFLSWTAKEWNQVQDFWWWNIAAPPTVHTHRDKGLGRPSLKACVWLGDPDCFRDQDLVLLPIADATLSDNRIERHELCSYPSGQTFRKARALATCRERGGVTPFNLLVHSNSDSENGGGSFGHGAATPSALVDWWARYICPPGGMLCDPFLGSGTTPVVAVRRGLSFVGCERHAPYLDIARHGVAEAELDRARPHRDKPKRVNRRNTPDQALPAWFDGDSDPESQSPKSPKTWDSGILGL